MRKIILIPILLIWSSAVLAQSPDKRVIGETEEDVIYKMDWFKSGYSEYSPSEEIIDSLASLIPEYSFIVFGATWCGDTHKHLPGFYKTLDKLSFSHEDVALYILDRRLKSPEKKEKKYKIKSVPVFIVLRDGKEIGRFTHKMDQSVEGEILKIIR